MTLPDTSMRGQSMTEQQAIIQLREALENQTSKFNDLVEGLDRLVDAVGAMLDRIIALEKRND